MRPLQESIQTYPGQLDSYININVAYQTLGQLDKALPYALKAVEISPEDAIASENLLGDYTGLMRLTDARAEMARGRKLGLDGSTDYAGISFIANFFLGEQNELQRLLAQVERRPDEFLVTQDLIGTQQFSGRYKLAGGNGATGFGTGRACQGSTDVQAVILLTDAAARGMADSCTGGDAVMQHALALDRSKQTQEFAVWAGAVCGGKQILPLAEELSAKYPEDTLIQDVFLPIAKAYAALSAAPKRLTMPARLSHMT